MRIVLLSISVTVLSAALAVTQTAAAQKPPAAAAAPVQSPAKPPPATAPPATAPPAKPTAPPTPAAGSAAEDAVRKASQAYLAALNAGDFKTAATFWTADGQYIDPSGKSVNARKVVAEDLAKRYSGAKKPQLALDVKSVRTLTSDSVLEEGTVEVQAPDGTAEPRGHFSSVWVKQQGKWLLKSVREDSAAALAHYYALSELGWLVGDWLGQADGTTIRIRGTWAPGRSFLLRDIRVERDGQVKHSVTQRIGLDPMSPKIKSWSFDTDGGITEAFWDKSGDTWHVYSRGATRDGQTTSAQHLHRHWPRVVHPGIGRGALR